MVVVTKQVDLLVQIGDFLNIDVYRRGFYALQCRVYHGSEETRTRCDAIPTSIVSQQPNQEEETVPARIFSLESCERNHNCSWRCTAQHRVFRTEVFRIESRDQVAEVNSAAIFTVELPAIRNDLNKRSSLFLEVDLYFLDLEKGGNPNLETGLKFQQSRRFKLSSIFDQDGYLSLPVIHSHSMVQFDGIFWATCDLIVSVASMGCSFRPEQEVQSRSDGQRRSNALSSSDLWWVPGSVASGVGSIFSEATEATATATLLKPLLMSCIHALHQLQESIEAAQAHLSSGFMQPDSRAIGIATVRNSVQTMKLAPTESSSSASTSQTTKYRLLSDAKIVALIANCLSVNTRESVVKVVDDSDVSDIMHECGLVIDEFLAGALNDVDAVAGLVRVVELVSSKIQCVWMIFTSDGGVISPDSGAIRGLRLQGTKQKLRAASIYAGAGPNSTDRDYNDALKRAKKLQSSTGPLPLCVQDDEFYKPVIVCAYNFSKDKESSLILKEDGSVEVRGQNEFCRKMESHFCGIDDDNKRDSFHSLSSLLEKPAGYHNPKHLIVFVHGLLGSSFDFRTYRNQIISTLRCSSFEDTTDHEYLMSEVNEEQTLNDISVLADRLASEIVTYVRDKKMYIEKLSFVCHSLGGLIARCAIQTETMDPYRGKFETYISLASPHLSLYFHNNSLVGSALKLYQYVGKSKCIDQLNLKDKENPRDSLLYKMAMKEDIGLQKFKHVKFFGSSQDGYVPVSSSLLDTTELQIRKQSQQDSEGTSIMIDVCLEMAKELTCIAVLEKYSVLFGSMVGVNFDVLGRKAHIAMLTDPALMEMLILLNNAHT